MRLSRRRLHFLNLARRRTLGRVRRQWATFLRNHDELDLSRLTADQCAEVAAAFGPQRRMQLYGRGLRRRLAPMLGNDRRRLELAYALQFSLPGTPVLRYGEEIGMGEMLALPGRNAFRTPMQWTDTRNAGFSTARSSQLIRPVLNRGEYGYRTVNVRSQRADENSLLSWFARLLSVRRECPQIGVGRAALVDAPLPPGVLAHRIDDAGGTMLFLHNLSPDPVTVDLPPGGRQQRHAPDVGWAGSGGGPMVGLTGVKLAWYGYRWLRAASEGRLP